jgi:hypothetical protein
LPFFETAMRILRTRHGFQADHSSSSYLFYAVDRPVSAAGQRVAHTFSSRAEVDEKFAAYQTWGGYELSSNAYRALMGAHYDVMAAESYESWTLMMAVPKTAQMEKLLRPFRDLDDGEFIRLDVHDYGKRLAVEVYCEFDYDGPLFDGRGDTLEDLVELLAEIRAEILQGNVSFLQAVAEFYKAGEEDEGGEDDEGSEAAPPPEWTKAELQQECARRGIAVRKTWTKDQLRDALAAPPLPPARVSRGGKPAKLSRAARTIVNSLTYR